MNTNSHVQTIMELTESVDAARRAHREIRDGRLEPAKDRYRHALREFRRLQDVGAPRDEVRAARISYHDARDERDDVAAECKQAWREYRRRDEERKTQVALLQRARLGMS